MSLITKVTQTVAVSSIAALVTLTGCSKKSSTSEYAMSATNAIKAAPTEITLSYVEIPNKLGNETLILTNVPVNSTIAILYDRDNYKIKSVYIDKQQ